MNKSPSLEFVIIIALMTAIIAFSIDAMLPALPLIAADLGAQGNDRQLVISALFLGLAFGQLFYGPISDTIGRRPAVVFGFVLFLAGCLVSIFARDFTTMLVGRVLQGLGAAGPRIVSIAIVRDRYEGPAMAKVMSLAMTLFILIPVIAPSLGQGLLAFGPWEVIFGAMFALGAVTLVWFWFRMEESLAPENRQPLSIGRVAAAFGECVRNHAVLGAALASGFVFSALIAYLSMAQQLFAETYGAGAWFPIIFGALAAFVGGSSLVNSQLVMRFGMRRLSWWALYAFTGAAAVFEVVAMAFHGVPPLALTLIWLAITFSTLGVLFSNLNALAMEPMGHIAGSAAAFIGASTTLMSAGIGAVIGRTYDGTVLPVTLAFLLLGIAAMASLGWAGTEPTPTKAT
jgi:MFS transporter, DHA1 family, multidrug resistance protein